MPKEKKRKRKEREKRKLFSLSLSPSLSLIILNQLGSKLQRNEFVCARADRDCVCHDSRPTSGHKPAPLVGTPSEKKREEEGRRRGDMQRVSRCTDCPT